MEAFLCITSILVRHLYRLDNKIKEVDNLILQRYLAHLCLSLRGTCGEAISSDAKLVRSPRFARDDMTIMLRCSAKQKKLIGTNVRKAIDFYWIMVYNVKKANK